MVDNSNNTTEDDQQRNKGIKRTDSIRLRPISLLLRGGGGQSLCDLEIFMGDFKPEMYHNSFEYNFINDPRQKFCPARFLFLASSSLVAISAAVVQ